MALRPPGRNFRRDTCRVLPLSDAADAAGGPTWADDPDAGVAFACQAEPGGPTAAADPYGGPPVLAPAPWRLTFAVDPGVTAAGQTLWVTHRGGDGAAGSGTALAPPVVLSAIGPAEPPGGLDAAWTVHARRVS